MHQRQPITTAIYQFVTLMGIFFALATAAFFPNAEASSPLLYEGRLLDSTRQPVVSPQSFRFSLWESGDFVAADKSGAEINIASPQYAGWQEEQVITPKNNGAFLIRLGEINDLPEFDPDARLFLQVEVKPSGAPKSAYQLLDPSADNGADTTDRKEIGSVPYANTAGTSESAAKSNESQFIIDAKDKVSGAGTGSIRLQFGRALAKFLEYDFEQGYFFFNDDVRIGGNLIVDGLINGVNFDNLPSGTFSETGTTSNGFLINSDGNSLLLSSSGLTAPRTVTFDDADTRVVGTDNEQTLTNKTIDGDENMLTDIGPESLKEREKSILLVPQVSTITVKEDGTNNLISLNKGYDEVENQQYFSVTSSEPTIQDIDLYIPFAIPDDFVSWQQTPITLRIKTSSLNSADARLDFSMEDSQKNPVTLIGGANLVSTGSPGSWKEYTVSISGTPVFTPGGEAQIKLKLHAKNGNASVLGHIRLLYIGK